MAYQCDLCQASFESHGGRKKHIEAVHKGIRFSCKICGNVFMQQNNLENHMRLHLNERPFKCNQCEKSYVAKKGLDRHLLSHLGEAAKTHECHLCKKMFMDRSRLKTHFNSHTSENKVHKCIKCGKAFASKSHLEGHMPIHSEERKFSCTICSHKSKTLQNLKNHLFTHQNLEPIHKCEQCEKKFTRKTYLHTHVKLNHTQNGTQVTETCVFCEKRFQKKKLFRHITDCHTKEKYYSCALCGQEFSESSRRKSHIVRFHTLEKHFSCGLCQHRSYTLAELRKHEISHSTKHHAKCGICGASFKSMSYLKIHQNRMHSDPELKYRHKCYKCDKRYFTLAQLKAHILSHEKGTVPASCLFCDKNFRYQRMLDNHMAEHIGEKPWICWICGAELLRKKNLRIHKTKSLCSFHYNS